MEFSSELRDRTSDRLAKISQRCFSCSEDYWLGKRISKCSCGSGLEFNIELGGRRFMGVIEDRNDMWRYKNLMPVREENIVSAGEGLTRVLHLKDLGGELGIELFVKLESENPTGTFKDREGAFVVSRSLEVGDNNIVMQSTGNTGISVSYYAGLAGLKSYFFGPVISRYKLIMPEEFEDNKIILVKGSQLDVKKYAERFAAFAGFPKISPFHERCVCNATQAYEVFEHVEKGEMPMPDFYIHTIAAGMGLIGFFSGMRNLIKWGEFRGKMPKIIGVQISEFCPMMNAWRRGERKLREEENLVDYLSVNPFEPTLHTTNASSYYSYLYNALKESGGVLTVVRPFEVNVDSYRFGSELRRYGIFLEGSERSAFIGYSGAVRCVDERIIPKGSNVLLMITGKGVGKGESITPDAIIDKNYEPGLLLEKLNRNERIGGDYEL